MAPGTYLAVLGLGKAGDAVGPPQHPVLTGGEGGGLRLLGLQQNATQIREHRRRRQEGKEKERKRK